MKKLTIGSALLLVGVLPMTAGVVGDGLVFGPLDALSIDMVLGHGPGSSADITRIVIDGNTGRSYPIIWQSAGFLFDPPGFTSTISGEGTRVLVLDYAQAFPAGDVVFLMGMNPDGDPGPMQVSVGDLVGVRVTIGGADGSTWVGKFVDDPAFGGGLLLASEIPEPGSASLFLIGIMASLVVRRRWSRGRINAGVK